MRCGTADSSDADHPILVADGITAAEAVLDALAARPQRPLIVELAVRDMPRSGTPIELVHTTGANAEAIANPAHHFVAPREIR